LLRLHRSFDPPKARNQREEKVKTRRRSRPKGGESTSRKRRSRPEGGQDSGRKRRTPWAKEEAPPANVGVFSPFTRPSFYGIIITIKNKEERGRTERWIKRPEPDSTQIEWGS
jgi:hypothetical protein